MRPCSWICHSWFWPPCTSWAISALLYFGYPLISSTSLQRKRMGTIRSHMHIGHPLIDWLIDWLAHILPGNKPALIHRLIDWTIFKYAERLQLFYPCFFAVNHAVAESEALVAASTEDDSRDALSVVDSKRIQDGSGFDVLDHKLRVRTACRRLSSGRQDRLRRTSFLPTIAVWMFEGSDNNFTKVQRCQIKERDYNTRETRKQSINQLRFRTCLHPSHSTRWSPLPSFPYLFPRSAAVRVWFCCNKDSLLSSCRGSDTSLKTCQF